MVAVSIYVITTEKDALVIPIDELLIPSNHFSSRSLAEVFAIDLRLVSMSVDVLGSLLGNLDGVTKGFFELDPLGIVARGMDWEALDFDGWLGVGSRCGTRDGDGSDFSVLDDWRSSSGGSKCCIEKELGTHVAEKE